MVMSTPKTLVKLLQMSFLIIEWISHLRMKMMGKDIKRNPLGKKVVNRYANCLQEGEGMDP